MLEIVKCLKKKIKNLKKSKATNEIDEKFAIINLNEKLIDNSITINFIRNKYDDDSLLFNNIFNLQVEYKNNENLEVYIIYC